MSSLREKIKITAKNVTEPKAPIVNPTPADRDRGYQLLRLTSQGSPPTNADIADRVASLQHGNRFLHVAQYTNMVRSIVVAPTESHSHHLH